MFRTSAALAITLLLGLPAYAGAAASGHDHGHAEGAQKLQLDKGQRWATDAPLRKAMGTINESLRGALPAIHEGRMDDAHYARLAEGIRTQVAYMVENCKLKPEADAQLHRVIARLLAGADAMTGAEAGRREGAVNALGALGDYARYFADDDFVPIVH